MSYGRTIELQTPYEEVVARVKEAFKEQGFGTLTEIDVKKTLKEKLNAEMEDYVILGACNPELARRALDIDRAIGLLLPCNVIVRRAGGKTLVEALDPEMMVTVTGRSELEPIAREASRRIDAAMQKLAAAVS